jgi:hypothetical protein
MYALMAVSIQTHDIVNFGLYQNPPTYIDYLDFHNESKIDSTITVDFVICPAPKDVINKYLQIEMPIEVEGMTMQ